jgi:NADH-quinone oxidoreductase subunit C
MNRSIATKLVSVFRDIDTALSDDGRLTIRVPKDSVVPVLRFLKDEGLNYLQLVSCVDWIEDGEFELVYVLSSYTSRVNPADPADPAGAARAAVILKTGVSRANPSLPSSIGVFPSAEPYERELHELFGVRFDGHPRLTPLFLEREYEIPPFRKDFDTRQYVEDHFGSIPQVGEED